MTEGKRQMFRALHRKGQPLVLDNVWHAGSARVSRGPGPYLDMMKPLEERAGLAAWAIARGRARR